MHLKLFICDGRILDGAEEGKSGESKECVVETYLISPLVQRWLSHVFGIMNCFSFGCHIAELS